MIKLQELTPKVYNNQSRDFQLLARLYDLVLNSIKTNTDLIYNCPLSENSDTKLIDLMSLTLGFSSRHNYNIKQLTALCSAFCYSIKYKGSMESIISACNALVGAEGISQTIEYELDTNKTTLTLYIPNDLSDTNLLKDLLAYILPAGMSCNIIKEQREVLTPTTDLTITDSMQKYKKERSTDLVVQSESISQYFDENIILGTIKNVIGNNIITEGTNYDNEEN